MHNVMMHKEVPFYRSRYTHTQTDRHRKQRSRTNTHTERQRYAVRHTGTATNK